MGQIHSCPIFSLNVGDTVDCIQQTTVRKHSSLLCVKQKMPPAGRGLHSYILSFHLQTGQQVHAALVSLSPDAKMERQSPCPLGDQKLMGSRGSNRVQCDYCDCGGMFKMQSEHQGWEHLHWPDDVRKLHRGGNTS